MSVLEDKKMMSGLNLQKLGTLRNEQVDGVRQTALDMSQKETMDNKELLDEAEHDIKNYPDRGQCYLPKPKAEADL